MRICVFGLWHLGTVTAACMADAGHYVVGLDPDENTVSDLNRAQPPLYEPNLSELVRAGIQAERLMFTTDPQDALQEADVVWVTFDTPVDDQDRANVDYVTDHVEGIFPLLKDGAVVLLSSQLPVGTCRNLEAAYSEYGQGRTVHFAVSPENLRLGKAIEVFTKPDRVVIGVRDDHSRAVLEALFAPLNAPLEWMTVESAEMTKHAINAFLAASVTFANEIAAICEQIGADAKQVERGLKTDVRIGQRAYLGAGTAFSGGTLARDIQFLGGLAQQYTLPLALLPAVKLSNDAHKSWAVRRAQEILGDLRGAKITLLGLTYKPGTDTLRRSLAIETARALHEHGAEVHAHDPAVQTLPAELAAFIMLHSTAEAAIAPAAAVILSTQWQDYLSLEAALFADKPLLDANGYLRALSDQNPTLRYYAVGQSRTQS